MRRIAVINQKGGVGKTTSVVNLGAALARAGRRVLLLDLDPQSHLTLHLGCDPAAESGGTYEALTQSTPLSQLRKQVAKNLWVVSSHIDLAAAEVELVSVVGREVILRDLLETHQEHYDYVLMDCPPSLGVLTLNALAAANEVFIPLQPHYLALHGLSKLLETVSLVARRINSQLHVTGVIVCMHEPGTRLASEVLEDVGAFLQASVGGEQPWAGARIFSTPIRRNIKLAECPSHGMTIFDYAPKSNGADDYAALALEVRAMVEGGLRPPLTIAKPEPAGADPAVASKPVADPVVDEGVVLAHHSAPAAPAARPSKAAVVPPATKKTVNRKPKPKRPKAKVARAEKSRSKDTPVVLAAPAASAPETPAGPVAEPPHAPAEFEQPVATSKPAAPGPSARPKTKPKRTATRCARKPEPPKMVEAAVSSASRPAEDADAPPVGIELPHHAVPGQPTPVPALAGQSGQSLPVDRATTPRRASAAKNRPRPKTAAATPKPAPGAGTESIVGSGPEPLSQSA